MMKQFLRVKQLADQTFSRSGKSEALSDELQLADRKVENLKSAVQAMCKRLSAPGGGVGTGGQGVDLVAREKRLKKLPEFQLGMAMQEACGTDDNKLLKVIMQECGKMQIKLANEIADHEARVEKLVGSELNVLTDQDLPNILKAKKQLSRLMNERETATSRLHSLQRQSEQNPVKISQARDEVEEAEQKADQSRDSLAAEMFSLIVKEADVVNFILQYVQLQTVYHKSVLDTLTDIVQQLETQIDGSAHKRVFGSPLEEHLRITGRTIAFPIELCVCALHELGLTEEGLFRMAGGSSRVKRMKLSLDSGIFQLPLSPEYRDVHVLASVLKSYLRELPEPLLTHHLHDSFLAAVTNNSTEESRINHLREVIAKLPTSNYNNLRYLIKFFSVLSQHQAVNKMTPSNISIVVAPNLLWSEGDGNMSKASTVNLVVEMLVRHADLFFKDDVNFYILFTKEDLLPDLCEYGFTADFGQGMVNHAFNPVNDHPNGEQTGHMSKSMHEYLPHANSQQVNAPKNSVHLVQNKQTHSRSNSHDTSLILVDNEFKRTQSNSSLSDHSSPPQGSPKPITRRKNKPIAPVPPNFTPPDKSNHAISRVNNSTNVKSDLAPTKDPKVSHSNKNESDKPEKPPRPVPASEPAKLISGVQTINRSTYKSKLGNKIGQHLASSRENLAESTVKERRKSFEFEHENVGNEPKPLEDVPPPVNCIDSIIAQHGTVGKMIISDSFQTSSVSKTPISNRGAFIPPKQSAQGASDHPVSHPPQASKALPVPAPRTTIPVLKQDAATFTDIESGYEVHLRAKPSVETNSTLTGCKPAVPERPATLRPQSFRNSATQKNQSLEMLALIDVPHNGNSGSGSTSTLLELTHMYSVDKQHPTIIHVGNSQDKLASPTGRVSDTGTGMQSPDDENKPNIQRTHSTGSNTQNVCKPESQKAEQKSLASQMRKLSQSEGNILDVPPSPRAYPKLPRPQEPAPPPPTMALKHKPDAADSTDL